MYPGKRGPRARRACKGRGTQLAEITQLYPYATQVLTLDSFREMVDRHPRRVTSGGHVEG